MGITIKFGLPATSLLSLHIIYWVDGNNPVCGNFVHVRIRRANKILKIVREYIRFVILFRWRFQIPILSSFTILFKKPKCLNELLVLGLFQMKTNMCSNDAQRIKENVFKIRFRFKTTFTQTNYLDFRYSTVLHPKTTNGIQKLFGFWTNVNFHWLANFIQMRSDFEGTSEQSISVNIYKAQWKAAYMLW